MPEAYTAYHIGRLLKERKILIDGPDILTTHFYPAKINDGEDITPRSGSTSCATELDIGALYSVVGEDLAITAGISNHFMKIPSRFIFEQGLDLF
jgi:hypothetical protein